MQSIINLLHFLNDSWTMIIIIIGLGITLYKKVRSYMKLSTQQKVDIAWQQIEKSILKIVSDAELEWKEFKKAGQIKRSNVINTIYKDYPILNKVADQETVINKIDELIDVALKEVVEVTEDAVAKAQAELMKS